MDLRTARIYPVAPYNFSQVLESLRAFPVVRNDQNINGRQLTKAFRLEGKTYAMQLRSKGSEEKPELLCTIISENTMDEHELENAQRSIRFFLGVDENREPFFKLTEADPQFRSEAEGFRGLPLIRFIHLFEATFWALVRSRYTPDEIAGIKKQLQQRLGAIININGVIYRAFPEPTDLLTLRPEEQARALPHDKLRRQMVATARKLQSADKYNLRSQDYEEIKAWLQDFPGIDEKGAIYILTHGVGRTEQIDYRSTRLTKAVARIYGDHFRIDLDKIRELARPYGPWKGYWAYYLKQLDRS